MAFASGETYLQQAILENSLSVRWIRYYIKMMFQNSSWHILILIFSWTCASLWVSIPKFSFVHFIQIFLLIRIGEQLCFDETIRCCFCVSRTHFFNSNDIKNIGIFRCFCVLVFYILNILFIRTQLYNTAFWSELFKNKTQTIFIVNIVF